VPLVIDVVQLAKMPDDANQFWQDEVNGGTVDLSTEPEWLQISTKAFGAAIDISVAVGRENGAIIGLLPFYRSEREINKVRVRAIELAGNVVSYHQEAIGSGWTRVLRRCVDSRWQNWDVVVGENLLRGGIAHAAFTEIGGSGGLSLLDYAAERSPFIELNCSWDEYLARKSSKFRNGIHRRDRRFAELGKTECRWYRNNENLDELVDSILEIERKSWKVDMEMQIAPDSREQRYYELLLPYLADRNALAANVEYLDDKAVAYSLCYVSNRRYAQLKTSFDNDYRKYGIGMIAIKNSVVDACETHSAEYDFLGAAMPHKLEWSTSDRGHTSCFLFGRTIKARLLGISKTLMAMVKTRK
jgi:CelD/BcsL family acetyltransferase involved in cellulose biosynthesis